MKRASAAKMRRARRAWDKATRKARVAENRYSAELRGLAAEVGAVYDRYLRQAFEKVAAKDAFKAPGPKPTADVKRDVARLRASLEKQIGPRVEAICGRMFRAVDDASKEYAGLVGFRPIDISPVIAESYTSTVEANVDLVVNAGRAYADGVVEVFTDPKNFGRRVEDLAAELQERTDVSESRAELIARDQTLKTLGALNEARQTKAGVTSYVWSTSLDGAVRPEHAALEGQTFFWDDPPEPGHPGEDYQCRCSAIPVIDEAEGLFGDLG